MVIDCFKTFIDVESVYSPKSDKMRNKGIIDTYPYREHRSAQNLCFATIIWYISIRDIQYCFESNCKEIDALQLIRVVLLLLL